MNRKKNRGGPSGSNWQLRSAETPTRARKSPSGESPFASDSGFRPRPARPNSQLPIHLISLAGSCGGEKTTVLFHDRVTLSDRCISRRAGGESRVVGIFAHVAKCDVTRRRSKSKDGGGAQPFSRDAACGPNFAV